MPDVRYLLAVKKGEPDDTVAGWRDAVQPRLSQPGWPAVVTDSTADFLARAVGKGGFEPWMKDAAGGASFDGSPRFHGVVVPSLEWAPCVPKGTYTLVSLFLRARKYAFLWKVPENLLLTVTNVQWKEGGNWQEWGYLLTKVRA